MKRVLLVQGHPDAAQAHLCHALADAYADGARAGGCEVRRLEVATLDFPVLRSPRDWEHGAVPPGLAQAQQDIAWAQHLVFFFPLWLGDMPALLKAFLEQVARPGFAFGPEARNALNAGGLKGRSARVVVTMGMPAPVYRWFFAAHAVRALKRNILGFVGIRPVRTTLVGGAGQMPADRFAGWSERLRKLGRQAR
jgi:putative NADPH-quinone reductase